MSDIYYSTSPTKNPTGRETWIFRALPGSDFRSDTNIVRVGFRELYGPYWSINSVG